MKQLVLDMGLQALPQLERYLAGPNDAALAHLRLWSSNQLRTPVPTYLWGDSGSGKTYLLHAVKNALHEQGEQVGWLDATAHHDAVFDPHCSAILLDDVHRYNEAQQAVAFRWFVEALSPLHGAPRWVLATGAVPPTDLQMRDDLRTRLGWGHVFALQVLGENERRAVLRQEADARGVPLSDEVIAYMLTRFSRDLSSLLELLDHLDQYALQTQRAITVPLIRSMLENQ
jgi:DnaA-homolog protein